MAKVEFVQTNEESFDIVADGVVVGTANHDNLGWEGMGIVSDLVQNMCRVLHIDFESDVDCI